MVAIAKELGNPIRYVGVGEQMNDLTEFPRERTSGLKPAWEHSVSFLSQSARLSLPVFGRPGYNDREVEFSVTRAKYVWDYDLAQDEFDDILAGRRTRGRLDRDWAAVRVIEWAPYQEMVRLIGFRALVDEWSRWRSRIRSEQQRRAIDFLVDWLPKHHPELLSDGR